MKMAAPVFQLRFAILLAALLLLLHAVAIAGDVQTDGKISVRQTAPLFAVCTDPIIQQTLVQDFRGAHRGPEDGFGAPVTVTVTVTEKLLKTGVVLSDLGPGDPWVIAKLLRQAGAEPPPIGDTGNKPPDLYAEEAHRQFMQPDDPIGGFRTNQGFRNSMMRPEGPKFGPNGNAKDEEIYDRAIVARATTSGSSDQMMAVVIAHPRDDVRTVKELLAEEIANSILH